MESKLDARRAMQDRLGKEGNPLIDLRCLDRGIAEEMEDRYEEQYISAKDGGETPYADKVNAIFAAHASDKAYVPTKGDVLAAWETELRTAFPCAFMKCYTRDEATTMLNLLNKNRVDGSLLVQFSPGFSANIFGLADGWNKTHPEEKPIEFTGYGDYMP